MLQIKAMHFRFQIVCSRHHLYMYRNIIVAVIDSSELQFFFVMLPWLMLFLLLFACPVLLIINITCISDLVWMQWAVDMALFVHVSVSKYCDWKRCIDNANATYPHTLHLIWSISSPRLEGWGIQSTTTDFLFGGRSCCCCCCYCTKWDSIHLHSGWIFEQNIIHKQQQQYDSSNLIGDSDWSRFVSTFRMQ